MFEFSVIMSVCIGNYSVSVLTQRDCPPSDTLWYGADLKLAEKKHYKKEYDYAL